MRYIGVAVLLLPTVAALIDAQRLPTSAFTSGSKKTWLLVLVGGGVVGSPLNPLFIVPGVSFAVPFAYFLMVRAKTTRFNRASGDDHPRR